MCTMAATMGSALSQVCLGCAAVLMRIWRCKAPGQIPRCPENKQTKTAAVAFALLLLGLWALTGFKSKHGGASVRYFF